MDGLTPRGKGTNGLTISTPVLTEDPRIFVLLSNIELGSWGEDVEYIGMAYGPN